MSLNIYFLRHGQTSSSQANLFCGTIDPPLTTHGAEMAQSFATAYTSTPWAAIYASPRERAINTATPLAMAVKIELQIREGLAEIDYGAWEGQDVGTVERQYHDDYLRWLADPGWNPPTNGESAIAIGDRALAVIAEIQQRKVRSWGFPKRSTFSREQHPTGNVLVVSHKATIRILLCSLLGIDVGRFRYRLAMPVSGLSIVEFGAHGPLLKVFADRSHLSNELRDLPGT